MIALVDTDNNVLNPHFLMKKLFDSKPAEAEEVLLTTDVTAGDSVLFLEDAKAFDDFKEGQEILLRDESKRETALIMSIDKDTYTLVLEQPVQNSFSLSDESAVTRKTIWDPAMDSDPENPQGGHFWIDNFTKGDGFTQFGLVLGCAVGIPALIATAAIYAIKERSYGWALASLWITLMISVSALGLVALE